MTQKQILFTIMLDLQEIKQALSIAERPELKLVKKNDPLIDEVLFKLIDDLFPYRPGDKLTQGSVFISNARIREILQAQNFSKEAISRALISKNFTPDTRKIGRVTVRGFWVKSV